VLLPIRSKNPPESFPVATILLIITNVFVYALTSNGFEIHESALKAGGLSYNNFSAWHILTSIFLHANLMHLLGNMWFLYLFGFAVEGRLRTFKFLIVYAASGLVGALAQTLILGQANPDILGLGASGAIMGVMGAALYLFPFGQIDFVYAFAYRFGMATWPMWGIALMYIGMDVLFSLIGDSGVAHLAHIGGVVGGLLVCVALRPQRDTEFVSTAKATLSETKDLSILSPVEMAEMHRVNPTDANLVLNWMHKSISKGTIDPRCQAAFLQMLPGMILEQDLGSVAFCVATLNASPGTIPARQALQVAGLIEHRGDAATALRLYDGVLKDPTSGPADHEAALYRMGLVYESMLQDFRSAEWAYNNVVQNWPMSPMGEQARARLAIVRRRLSAVPTP
jgi:membrane associated rhomboid family serine protease